MKEKFDFKDSFDKIINSLRDRDKFTFHFVENDYILKEIEGRQELKEVGNTIHLIIEKHLDG